MAFWKFTGASAEAFPTLGLTAKPGYVYDLGSGTPPVEPLPKEGQVYPLVLSKWTSDPGPATDALIKQGTDLGLAPVKTGAAVLASGTKLVSDANITANSIIRLSQQTTAVGVAGVVFVSARVPGTSFTITSSNANDTSTIYYEILSY